ncbi:hypothetical protein H0X06_03785 [Candidatus Dependentiae bacterium]|nr:hypothetical protein [Candidatus Dependentiae bacterium]
MNTKFLLLAFSIMCYENIRAALPVEMVSSPVTVESTTAEEWITVLIHGVVGLQANISFTTLFQAKRDLTEGTIYEKNVLELREHPFLSMIQPIGKLGLHPAKKNKNWLSAAYAFGALFSTMERICKIHRKNYFYTFGWSGLVSCKRRHCESRTLYTQLSQKIAHFKRAGKNPKIRLIGFSHGATLLLNLADIRNKEFSQDSFSVDEVYLIGLPVTRITSRQAHSSLFKAIYSIYSRQDKVQKLDIFSSQEFSSHRLFKGRVPDSLTQIELRISAPLRPNPLYCPPSFMRGVINQSPGHSELWFFGWTQTSYRKNLNMYPLPAALFAPYLICAAQKTACKNIQIDIRPCTERALLRFQNSYETLSIPFLSHKEYTDLIKKAFTFHPSNPQYKENFLKQQTSIVMALREKGQTMDAF